MTEYMTEWFFKMPSPIHPEILVPRNQGLLSTRQHLCLRHGCRRLLPHDLNTWLDWWTVRCSGIPWTIQCTYSNKCGVFVLCSKQYSSQICKCDKTSPNCFIGIYPAHSWWYVNVLFRSILHLRTKNASEPGPCQTKKRPLLRNLRLTPIRFAYLVHSSYS